MTFILIVLGSLFVAGGGSTVIAAPPADAGEFLYAPHPETTALLIIDAQKEYFDSSRPLYVANSQEVLVRLQALRRAASAAGAKVIFVRHAHDPDGSDLGRMGDFDPTPLFIEGTPWVELADGLSPSSEDVVVTKTRYSAFEKTALESILRQAGVDTLIVTGFMTNFCSVTTARQAHDMDFKTIFAVDANSGPGLPDLGFGEVSPEEIQKVIATTLAAGVAEVVTTQEIVRYWER